MTRLFSIIPLLLLFAVSGESRTWTDASGRHETKATLSEVQGDVAYLKKSSGQIVAVPLKRFSAPDREYIERNVAPREILRGKVVGVTDGDTITVLDDEKVQHKIRLGGIDAPESSQAFGAKAKHVLSTHVFNKYVTVEWTEKGRYGRTIGDIFVTRNGKQIWVNKDLVDEGFAWHYKEYSKSEVSWILDGATRRLTPPQNV